MRKVAGLMIAVSLLLLPSAFGAQLDLSSDPVWRALMAAPPGAPVAPAAVRPVSPRGGAQASKARSASPECGPAPDCGVFDFGACVYSWDPDSCCCLAESPPWQVCRSACF
jgi:hypothetical protein